MTIVDNIQLAVEKAFNETFIGITATYNVIKKSRGVNDFNTVTGQYTSTDQNSTLRGIVTKITKKDIEEYRAEPESKKFICINSELVALPFVLTLGDAITIGGIIHNIYSEKIDSANIVKVFFLKASS